MSKELIVKFDGYEAAKHHLPMGRLGDALIGVDKVANAGLILFSEQRRPRPRERARVQLIVEAPRAGSMTIKALLEHIPWALPLTSLAVNQGAGVIMKHFISLALARFSKNPSETKMHLDALTQHNRDNLAARNASEKQWQEFTISVIDKLRQPTIQMVSPIGNGAKVLQIETTGSRPGITVDENMADIIRLGEKDVIEDAVPMNIVVDGVIHHSRQLKILHPEIEGRYLTANIRDPIFDVVPSPYHNAASRLREISVLAKPVRRDGDLVGLFIIDLIK